MAKQLTPRERQALKGRAHSLDPVVFVGAEGLTAAVLIEIDRALRAHELVKIRVMDGSRDGRQRVLGEICAAADASPVQHIGKILVIYRARPEDEQPAPSSPRPAPRLERQPSRARPATPRRVKLRSR